MVHSSPLHWEHDTATIRALSSLTRHDADAVRATVRAAGGEFVVEEHDDYDGYLSLILTPACGAGPGYLVGGRSSAVDVAALEDDGMCRLGRFASIGAAMVKLKGLLETEMARRGPNSTAEGFMLSHGADAGQNADTCEDPTPGQGWALLLRAIDVCKAIDTET